uniref:Uncharacterized protein n=1 Tax=Anguilla anguilla TaxID=7936 RepID=A0A0E9PTF6_ANGAN
MTWKLLHHRFMTLLHMVNFNDANAQEHYLHTRISRYTLIHKTNLF